MNHKKAENQIQVRMVRAEMARHGVDCGAVQITVSNHVVYLYGRVRSMRGYENHFTEILEAMIKGIRQISGIREVVTQWQTS